MKIFCATTPRVITRDKQSTTLQSHRGKHSQQSAPFHRSTISLMFGQGQCSYKTHNLTAFATKPFKLRTNEAQFNQPRCFSSPANIQPFAPPSYKVLLFDFLLNQGKAAGNLFRGCIFKNGLQYVYPNTQGS